MHYVFQSLSKWADATTKLNSVDRYTLHAVSLRCLIYCYMCVETSQRFVLGL